MLYILLPLFAYLIGSIPTAVWVGKWFYNIDIREHGSKNAGATNTIRVLGWKAGLPVFLIDILKGFVAVTLIAFVNLPHNSNYNISFQLILGFSAMIGHVFPIFSGFKGGKGVATLLGVVLAISLVPALLSFLVFIIVLFLFKYVSVGSIIAGISYPIFVIFVFQYPLVLEIAAGIMAIALIITHKKNIQRLLAGTESKATFLFKK